MKSQRTLLLVLLSFIYTGCKDDDDPVTPPVVIVTYQPTTTNSVWNYQTKDLNTSVTTTYKVTATAKDSMVNGRSYKVFTNSAGSNEYYAATGTDYYQYAGFAGITSLLELNYLQAALSANGTWSEAKTVTITGLPTAVPVTFVYTVKEKLSSLTVEGKSYANVTHVEVKLNLSGLYASLITAQSIHFYYAAGVGRIKSQIQLTAPLAGVNGNTETTLTSSTIVP